MCISFGLIFCTKNEILSTKAACPFSKRRRRVMKKMTRRRITALFMAVLMVVGILPLSMLTGIFSSKAQAKTIVAEMPESAKAGDTVATIGNAKLVAVQDLKNSKHETALEDDNGNTYAYGVKGTSVKNITIDGKDQRAVAYITASEDTEVVLTFLLPKKKTGYIVTSDTDLGIKGTADEKVAVTVKATDATYKASDDADKVVSHKFTAEAGKYYYLLGVGTDLEILGLSGEVNESKSETATMPDSAKFGTEIKALNAKLVASQDLKNSKHETALEDDNGNTYTCGIKGTSVKNITIDGKDQRAVAYITASEDTEVVLTFLLPKKKTGYIVTSDTDLGIKGTADEKVAVTVKATDATYKASDDADKVVSHKFTAEAGKYYYLLGVGTDLEILGFSAKTGGEDDKPVVRKDWSEVVAPVISDVKQDKDTVKVTYAMVIGDDGADKLSITMKDSNGKVVDTKSTAKKSSEGTFEFKPAETGKYTFSIVASRADVEDKTGADKEFDYVLPLTEPTISAANGDGKDSVTLEWKAVKDSDKYVVSYKAASDADYTVAGETTDVSYKVSGLKVGTKYTFKVTAVRLNPAGETEATLEKEFTKTAERWKTAFIGTQAGDNESGGYVTVKDDGSVEMYAPKGKFASSNDGWVFYYTEVVSDEENFVYKAKMNLLSTADNQSGAGLLVADTIGRLGSRDLCQYANYMLNGEAKIEFVDENGVKTTYSNGYGVRKVTGGTAEYGEKADGRTVNISNSYFNDLTSENIISPANIAAKTCDTELELTLVKDNNGYHAYLADAQGVVIHQYDPSKFLQQDKDKVYVGLAVSRGTKATFSDISFESRKPSDDPAKDESTWEKDYTPKNLFVYAGSSTSSPEYNYRYYGNWDANVTLTDDKGNEYFSKNVGANETISYDITLTEKKTTFITTITPDPEKVVLQSYDPVVIEKTVTMDKYGNEGETIIVTPDGSSKGDGTEENPLDIYTAVKYAQPGQVILLKNGTYDLVSDLVIPYSVSGREDAMITLMAEEVGKVTLDGSNADPTGTGQMVAVNGNYWHLYGLEICNSTKLKKGIQVSGNNNIIEFCDIHNNGTTGLQISRSGGEPREWWPKNNLIKNCDSYNNCDVNYNDADGFGAKLTVGEGNKFYGCMAYNNIDDGWDLYAKNEAGQGAISPVVIENCVAFNNGWLPGDDKTGEGNGFKLGGEGLPGAHQLINCVSFNNGAKGVASNNGPDCQVINCTVFNNNLFYAKDTTGKVKNSYNISLSPLNGSKYAGTTNYVLKNTISLYTFEKGQADQIALVGQDALDSDDVYLVNSSLKSLNKSGAEATVDWFESVDTSIVPTRNENGTINMHNILVLKSNAPAGIGAVIVTTGDAVSVAPSVTTVVAPRTGDTSNIAFLLALFLMSGAAIAAVCIYDRKRRIVK